MNQKVIILVLLAEVTVNISRLNRMRCLITSGSSSANNVVTADTGIVVYYVYIIEYITYAIIQHLHADNRIIYAFCLYIYIHSQCLETWFCSPSTSGTEATEGGEGGQNYDLLSNKNTGSRMCGVSGCNCYCQSLR